MYMEHGDYEIRVLVEASVKGDAESCKKLYEQLVNKVYAYVRYRTATNEQATDVTQDVFIDFFSTLSSFTYQTRAQFYGYLFVITRRKLARYYEERKRRGIHGAVEFNEDTMSPSPLDTPHELRNDVSEALKFLDGVTREIMVLHHWSKYTFGEIAVLLNMTESAVRVRHHRALAVLAERLER